MSIYQVGLARDDSSGDGPRIRCKNYCALGGGYKDTITGACVGQNMKVHRS